MNNPLFSILIAQYNNGKYLTEAIESIKSQTYTNWEIIIVDDCSTDNSKELYKQYENDDRIKIYYNEENKGCGYTKRRCVELASGEICGFLDPEDTLTPDALQIMLNVHLKESDAALIASRYNFCDENLRIMWISEVRPKQKILNYLTDRNHAAEAFTTFKMQAYKKTVGINPNIKRAVDMDLYFKLEEVGDFLFIDDILYNYRLHKGGISQTSYKARFWHLIVIKDACERRNIDVELVADKILSKDALAVEVKYNETINSSYYKLGKFILFPFYRIKRKLKKIFNQNK